MASSSTPSDDGCHTGAAAGDIDALADLNEAVQEAAADYAQE